MFLPFMDRPLIWALLLIAASFAAPTDATTAAATTTNEPFTNHGGWGGIQSTPSENECRSFIEKALKEQRSQTDSPLADENDAKEQTDLQEDSSEIQNQVDETETKQNDGTPSSSEEEKGQPEQSISDEDNVTELTNEESVEIQDKTSTETSEENENIEIQTEEVNDSETAEEVSKEEDKEESKVEDSVNESDEENESTDLKDPIVDTAVNADTDENETIKSEENSHEEIVELTTDSLESSEIETDTANKSDAENEDGKNQTSEEENEIVGSEFNQDKVPVSAESTEESSEQDPENEVNAEKTEESEKSDSDNALPSEKTEEPENALRLNETDDQLKDTEQENEILSEDSAESEQKPDSLTSDKEVSPDLSSDKSIEESESGEDDSKGNKDSEEAKTKEDTHTEKSETLTEDKKSIEIISDESSNETKHEKSSVQNEEDGSNETLDEEPLESPDEEDLLIKMEIPANLRPKTHITEVLRLDSDSLELEAKLHKTEETILKDLKRLYETAIKPLEILYKYRDLSNRHFGDSEIFSKPLILFMGPWSGGKSTIINYLLDNEYKKTALRTGAEPSPAYFNIVMKGEREEILDGTQLAADWTFSGLQKFGQGLLDRLRGLKLNHSLLDKVNIVEIPGILEIRKQVERLFPFNDACQWFIDRADIIFLVYDPSKLDVGPETEAILDQLKGREYQTRIILNKADQVKPEELMRVQGTLIWNISPLMSSTEPPVMYSTSLWSIPYEAGSPTRLLFAQEKAFLRDLRDAVDKRVENKIASARRFAVRVRNHAKMVDCYLTTYYNHKSFFGNRQKVADDIIEHPQNYHIYEGLSTLTNISRYDLPDPDVYKDFFRLNPVYDFQNLASTCTYFRGCPINRLDVAIAYDLPELVGKYKKLSEDVTKVYNKSKGDEKGRI